MDKLREADVVMDALYGALRSTDMGLDNVPGLLLRMINENLWQERIVRRTGEIARFSRFEQFVTTQPLEGLGSSMATLRRVCALDPAALDALDRATMGRQGERIDLVYNIHEVSERPTGTSAAAATRRLRKDRPDLHAAVLAGEKTPHGAMVEAGLRRKTITVPLDVSAAARTIARHFTPDEIRELVEILGG